jgi:hypothetical protein
MAKVVGSRQGRAVGVGRHDGVRKRLDAEGEVCQSLRQEEGRLAEDEERGLLGREQVAVPTSKECHRVERRVPF